MARQKPSRWLTIILIVLVGIVAGTWAGAVWLERTHSIPAHLTLAVVFGALASAEIIKRVNRRDDQRHAKRPADPP
jgi:uncharacterized membrane protein